jgi:hypothetical protein
MKDVGLESDKGSKVGGQLLGQGQTKVIGSGKTVQVSGAKFPSNLAQNVYKW